MKENYISRLLQNGRMFSSLLQAKLPVLGENTSTNYRFASSFSTPVPETNKWNITNYRDLYQFSINNRDEFWGTFAKSRLDWIEDFKQVSDCDLKEGRINWFPGGKLNVSVNCVDRHALKTPDKVALIWERDEPGETEKVTYKELLDNVCRFANCLLQSGVKKGDCVTIYMPVSPIAVASMLACARIGAVHNVVFAGFSAEALAQRIQDANSETLITTDQGIRGGKIINLKSTADKAVAMCPTIKRVFMNKRTGNSVSWNDKMDINLDDKILQASSWCDPEPMDSEDWLFMLYTSGSTGKPKGLVHTQAGYLLYAAVTNQMVFDVHNGDIFGCVADIGWITGHSYVVYGPLCNGTTTLLFESIPLYPDPGRYWSVVEEQKLTQFYGAPTAIRLLLRYGDSWVKKYDRSSLRVLGSVGEPINHEAWEWYNNIVGDKKCALADTWWQTETGGIMITPRPSESNATILPSMPMRPFFGIEPAVVGEDLKEVHGTDTYGACCVKSVWPGMARTIVGDHERFLDTYYKPYPGYYFSGDGLHKNADGYYQITGRMDDVINISGHRLGTAEIEDVLDEHKFIAESAVVGVPHKIKGESPFAFVTPKINCSIDHTDLRHELVELVRNQISSFAIPGTIMITDGLPKTRSGKIMRRILRKIAAGETDDLGDVSTLADPSVVKQLIDARGKLSSGEN